MPESVDRGALTEAVYYILLAMYTPNHGYGVMQLVSEISVGRVNLGAGTLYGAINTLLQKGWITAVGSNTDSRKKEYVITESGKRIVTNEMNRLQELMANGQRITGGVIQC